MKSQSYESDSEEGRKFFVFDSLKKVMPERLWVGEIKDFVQAAYLSEENNTITYDMSNEWPQKLPKHALYFKSYNDVQNWIMNINKIASNFFYKWNLIEKLTLISTVVNTYLDWHEFIIIKRFKEPIQKEFKSLSIIRYLESQLEVDKEALKIYTTKVEIFLRSNCLMEFDERIDNINPENLISRLVIFDEEWKELYYDILSKHYHIKTDKYISDTKGICEALNLVSRTGDKIPMIASHRFIYLKYEESIIIEKDMEKNKENRKKMLERYHNY